MTIQLKKIRNAALLFAAAMIFAFAFACCGGGSKSNSDSSNNNSNIQQVENKSQPASLAGTKWVCKDSDFTQIIIFLNETDYEVDGELSGTYSVDSNRVLMQRDEMHIDAFELKGDELIFTAPSGDSMVYKKQ